jgi:hypothetical protein
MSNLNRIFHALRAHHGPRAMTRRQFKKLAILTVRNYPDFHRFHTQWNPDGSSYLWDSLLGRKVM